LSLQFNRKNERAVVMKTNKLATAILSNAAVSLAVVLLLTANSLQVHADSRHWVGGTGNWLDTSNWGTSSGGSGGASVPGAGDFVYISPSAFTPVDITYEQPSSFELLSIRVNKITAGTLTLIQTQDELNSVNGVIGRAGNGTLALSGGSFSISDTLRVGSLESGTGFINLSGSGVLSADTLMVGDDGTGTVNQTGGAASASTLILGNDLGTGSYTLDAGSLDTSFATVRDGLFTQNGGTHTIANDLTTINNYTMNGGTMDISGTLFGDNFTYDGGTLIANVVDGGVFTVDGNTAESIAISSISNATFDVSNGQSVTGITTINSGQYNISGNSSLTATASTGGGFSVTGNSALDIQDLVVSSGLTVSADSTLDFTNLTQTGGTVSSAITVDAGDTFNYVAGTFDGLLTNNGQTDLHSSNFTTNGGLVNNGTVDFVNTGSHALTVNGTGLDNNGALNFTTGTLNTLNGTGPLVNDGTISSGGSLSVSGSGGFTNNGQLTVTSGALTLGNSGPNSNSGTINAAFQNDVILNAGLSNSGALNLNGGNLGGTATLTNISGGALNGNGAVTTDIVNGGTVDARSGNLVLAGSNFTNTGLVRNSVGSNLFINSASVAHTGSIEVNAAGAVVFAGNVSNTSGETVTMNGGSLSTAGLTNDSGATISGFGSLTGNITNAGSVDFFGNTSLVGDLGNQVGGHFLVRNDQTLITGLTTNDGTIETLNGEVIFEGGLINNGALLFDPSIITLTTLEVGVDGYLAETGEPGDLFVVQEDLKIASNQNSLWTTENTIFQFNGGARDAGNPQSLEVAGADVGNTATGWLDNFMLGTLLLGTSNTYVQLIDESDNSAPCLSEYCEIWSSEALYVGDLIMEAGTTLDLAGLNLYVMNDFFNNGGTVLNGTVTVVSAVPVPAAFYLFGTGLLGLAGVARERRRA
jgi:hypothetical protein